MDVVALESLQAIGKFFLQPLTYVIIVAMVVLGYIRVRRERQTFHLRTYKMMDDFWIAIGPSIGIGLIISLCTIALGITVNGALLSLMSAVFFLLLLTGRVGFLTPAHTMGSTVLLAFLLPLFETGQPVIDEWKANIVMNTPWATVLLLMALLMVAEGILVLKNGRKHTSPVIARSSRGKKMGGHRLQRLWLVPMFLFIPEGTLPVFEIWPVLPIEYGSLALTVFPVPIGHRYSMFHTLPEEALSKMGRKILALAIVVLIGALFAYLYPVMIILTAAIAVFVREHIRGFSQLIEYRRTPVFVPRSRGVTILAVLPGSPADKMGLHPGEVILKANGHELREEGDLYRGIQKNSAYCKLEVADRHGEIRHTQSAVYDNEHHEIGVLLVKESTDFSYYDHNVSS